MLLIHKISPPYTDKPRPCKIEPKPKGKYPTKTPKFWLRIKTGWLVTWPIFLSHVELTRCRHSILQPWFNQGEWLEWPSRYPKKSWLHYMYQFVLVLHASICLCITCINLVIAYHKNDLEILTVIMVCPVSKLDHRIERYRMIKLHSQHALCLGRVNHTWSI